MKFYIIETDQRNPLPDIRKMYSEIPVKYLVPEFAYKLQDDYVFEIITEDETLLPDIFTVPFFMVKRDLFRVIMMYIPEIKAKYISLVDVKRERYETYVMPVLEMIDRRKLEEIDASDKLLFYVTDFYERYVVIRLDMLESFLRRDAMGVKAREFSINGEASIW